MFELISPPSTIWRESNVAPLPRGVFQTEFDANGQSFTLRAPAGGAGVVVVVVGGGFVVVVVGAGIVVVVGTGSVVGTGAVVVGAGVVAVGALHRDRAPQFADSADTSWLGALPDAGAAHADTAIARPLIRMQSRVFLLSPPKRLIALFPPPRGADVARSIAFAR